MVHPQFSPFIIILSFVHDGVPDVFVPALGDCMAPMITSQNDKQSPTTAGTNASPMNSVIFSESSLSAHLKASPRVYFSVKSGEKIA